MFFNVLSSCYSLRYNQLSLHFILWNLLSIFYVVLRDLNHWQIFSVFPRKFYAFVDESITKQEACIIRIALSRWIQAIRRFFVSAQSSSILITKRHDSISKLIIAIDSLGLHYVKRFKVEPRPGTKLEYRSRGTIVKNLEGDVPSFVREIFNDVGNYSQ